MTTGRNWTLAGTGGSGDADGGPGVCKISSPNGVAVSPSTGNVFVSSRSVLGIRMVTPAGICSTIAGIGTGGTADGVGTNAGFKNPQGIALDDQSGVLYVPDFGALPQCLPCLVVLTAPRCTFLIPCSPILPRIVPREQQDPED